MADKITLTLTLSEAKALNALAQSGADWLLLGLDDRKSRLPEKWNPRTAARACDKLQRAILPGLPDEMTLTGLLQDMGAA